MRIFLAGASGVIGQRLIPRLVQAGHVVGGLTRSPSKTELLSHLGAEPILCDVFDREALIQAVRDFKPDVVLNELTDLPDDAAQISELADLNARIRTEGTRNLIEAARRSGSPKILAQSVAWQLPDGPDAQAVAELERSVLAEGGVVLRYGQFYGPGTYNEQQPPEEPRVHIDRAAERTVEALGEPTGVVVIIDWARDRDPACAKVCPTESIVFGRLDDLRARGAERVQQLQQNGYNDAQLYDPTETSVRGTQRKSRLEIGHVLFIDIGGYSKLTTEEESEVLPELNPIVRDTEAVREAEAAQQLIFLPTGGKGRN